MVQQKTILAAVLALSLTSQFIVIVTGATRKRWGYAEWARLGKTREAETCHSGRCSTENYWEIQQHQKTSRFVVMFCVKIITFPGHLYSHRWIWPNHSMYWHNVLSVLS